MDKNILDQLAPFPNRGPLDDYRSKAGFDWREFRIKFHTQEILELKMKIWNHMKSDPTFAHDEDRDDTLEKKRSSTFKKVVIS